MKRSLFFFPDKEEDDDDNKKDAKSLLFSSFLVDRLDENGEDMVLKNFVFSLFLCCFCTVCPILINIKCRKVVLVVFRHHTLYPKRIDFPLIIRVGQNTLS